MQYSDRIPANQMNLHEKSTVAGAAIYIKKNILLLLPIFFAVQTASAAGPALQKPDPSYCGWYPGKG